MIAAWLLPGSGGGGWQWVQRLGTEHSTNKAMYVVFIHSACTEYLHNVNTEVVYIFKIRKQTDLLYVLSHILDKRVSRYLKQKMSNICFHIVRTVLQLAIYACSMYSITREFPGIV